MSPGPRIGVDIGGTFTDLVAFDPSSGRYRSRKRLSTPADPAVAVLAALAEEPGTVASVVHGSTVATNAVLERAGARTALVTTGGFRDLLAIGRQARPALYDFHVDRPPPLVPAERCFELSERVDHRGQVLEPLTEEEIEPLVGALRDAEVEAVAVCLLFSFLHPEHEARVAARLREAGFFVSASSEVLPEFREYERASTTALNAYVTPVLDRYLGRLAEGFGAAGGLRIMQSNGGSTTAEAARREGVRSILSGPAGGVVGAIHVARRAGCQRIITFDMGGTSTDVSLSLGAPRVTSEAEIGSLPIRVPVIDLHTVGSGGGSIAAVDAGGALRVGPRSAGSEPGPACYGRGGPHATVTDANLVLGRLPAEHFLGGAMPLDVDAAHQALDRLAREAGLRGSGGLEAREEAALGVLRVANAHMERALRVISVERGHDPHDFTLVSFGGAGGLHAGLLARGLGLEGVLVPPEAATLSALGMLIAPVVKDYVRTVMLAGEVAVDELEELAGPLAERGGAEVAAEGIPLEEVRLVPELDLRYVGQSYEITVGLSPGYRAAFDAEHRRLYGHADPGAPIEIVNLRLRALGGVDAPSPPAWPEATGPVEEALLERRTAIVGGGGTARRAEVPVYDGEALRPGHTLAGPAIVVRKDTTVFLDDRDGATLDRFLNLWIDGGAVDDGTG